jgi:hypothetical protein
MPMGSLARLPVSFEEPLDLLERGCIHEGRVLSLVLDALVGHDAGVVTVSQDLMQLVPGQRTLRAARGTPLQ